MIYRPACFASLPSLGEARSSFIDKEAGQYLEGPIRQLFLDSKVEDRYGVALLHRHFPIQPTQRLVDYHHTATAWTVDDPASNVIPKYDGLIIPRTYLFDGDGALSPYEFEFLSNKDSYIAADTKGDKEFFSALYALLCQYNLDKIFGIRDLQGYDPALSVEVTEGSANIMLPPTAIPSDNLIEAMWTFSSDDTTRRCHCREYCFPVGREHEANHGCS